MTTHTSTKPRMSAATGHQPGPTAGERGDASMRRIQTAWCIAYGNKDDANMHLELRSLASNAHEAYLALGRVWGDQNVAHYRRAWKLRAVRVALAWSEPK